MNFSISLDVSEVIAAVESNKARITNEAAWDVVADAVNMIMDAGARKAWEVRSTGTQAVGENMIARMELRHAPAIIALVVAWTDATAEYLRATGG